jgi:hypothetical protein
VALDLARREVQLMRRLLESRPTRLVGLAELAAVLAARLGTYGDDQEAGAAAHLAAELECLAADARGFPHLEDLSSALPAQ